MQRILEILLAGLLVSVHSLVVKGQTDEDFDSNLLVELPFGKVLGQDNGYYYSFEGIPYAEPPIDELRFEDPVPYSKTWSDVFDAKTPNPPIVCMQWNQFKAGDNKLVGVEDCLVMNIYKPKLKQTEEMTDSEGRRKFPVFVFIHGGAFMFGSTLSDDHTGMLKRGHFIVVKPTYRLGPLGFLSTEDDIIPGNFGLKDQRLALQWIEKNIGYFGGDTERIILAGFSAGGASVHYQMLQPDLKFQAKAAISFSGTAFCPWALIRNARLRAFQLARNLNCTQNITSNDIKDCLKKQKAADIVSEVRNFLVFGYNPFTTFGPVIESPKSMNAFLPQSPEEIIQSGNFSQIPWLVAYTAQDGGYNAAELLQKQPRREELIEIFNDRWYDLAPYTLFFKDSMTTIEELDDYSMALKKLYLGDKDFTIESYHDLQRMYTDVLFKNGIEKAVRLHRDYGKSPVYAYVYDNPSEENLGIVLSQRKDIKFGTVHGDDFSLIFRSIIRQKALREDEEIISTKMKKMLEDFAVNSNELKYGECKFVNNVGQIQLALTHITQDTCEILNVDRFP